MQFHNMLVLGYYVTSLYFGFSDLVHGTGKFECDVAA